MGVPAIYVAKVYECHPLDQIIKLIPGCLSHDLSIGLVAWRSVIGTTCNVLSYFNVMICSSNRFIFKFSDVMRPYLSLDPGCGTYFPLPPMKLILLLQMHPFFVTFVFPFALYFLYIHCFLNLANESTLYRGLLVSISAILIKYPCKVHRKIKCLIVYCNSLKWNIKLTDTNQRFDWFEKVFQLTIWRPKLNTGIRCFCKSKSNHKNSNWHLDNWCI